MRQSKRGADSAAGKSKRAAARVPVEATKHPGATRKNIPTAELEAFARDAEKKPTTVLYPRDPSLDPQLVWRGKDEQDAKPLAVPSVPIYIQEKIAPRAIIEGLRAEAKRGNSEPQLDLFGDFNGLEFEQAIEFYQHDQHWSNRMILGDSLAVMTSLAEKEGLRGKVQSIYVDPPYGIRFGSNWQVSTRKRDVRDGRVEDASREPEVIRAFRDTWQLGVHSYLAYTRDRAVAARELLAMIGSVFVQIGDQNIHLVRCVLDEVFGADNFVALITFKKTTGATSVLLPSTSDYILWYAKDVDQAKYRALFHERSVGDVGAEAYTAVELTDGTRRRLSQAEASEASVIPEGSRPYRLQLLESQRQGRPSGPGSAMYFPVRFGGREFYPSATRGWTTTAGGIERLGWAGRLAIQGASLSYVRYLQDFPAVPIGDLWQDTQSGSAMDKVYVVQTNTRVVERCVLMTTDPGDLVLDPTCGSGTTAYVAEQWGRRWITIDTSRVAAPVLHLLVRRWRFGDAPRRMRVAGESTP